MEKAMTEFFCNYGDDRDGAIVAFLYDDPDGRGTERARFELHLPACARCQADIAALRGVRTQLARWSPPEPSLAAANSQSNLPSAFSNQQWWRSIPVWAQAAAALLLLGVSAGLANLDVHYDHNGLSVRPGWSGGSGGSGGSGRSSGSSGSDVAQRSGSATAPWKTDLAALESQLKNEIRLARATTAAATVPSVRPVTVSTPDADAIRRVRALVEESEKRQQRELALRIAELLRDVNAQRQADLVKIDRTLGVVQNNVGIEVMKNRQQINQMDLLYRASQRQ
jgi:hypothetical protein